MYFDARPRFSYTRGNYCQLNRATAWHSRSYAKKNSVQRVHDMLKNAPRNICLELRKELQFIVRFGGAKEGKRGQSRWYTRLAGPTDIRLKLSLFGWLTLGSLLPYGLCRAREHTAESERERERDGISNSTINLHRSRAHESGELVRTQKPNPNRSLPMLPSGTSPFMNSSHVNGFAGFVAVRRACRKMNRASTMNFLSTIRDTRDTAVIQIKRTNLPVADDWKMI